MREPAPPDTKVSTRPPALIRVTVLLLVLVGLGWVAFGLLRDVGWLWVGPVVLVVAFGVWRGFKAGRYAGLLLGVVGLLPGVYGMWGSSIVLQDWLGCVGGRLAAVATSRPSGYCETANWLQSFGTGALLIGLGLVGVVTLAGLLRHADFFERGPAAS